MKAWKKFLNFFGITKKIEEFFLKGKFIMKSLKGKLFNKENFYLGKGSLEKDCSLGDTLYFLLNRKEHSWGKKSKMFELW